jgi:hypothetical protein
LQKQNISLLFLSLFGASQMVETIVGIAIKAKALSIRFTTTSIDITAPIKIVAT